MPTPRLELRALAGYRIDTVQIAVAASCHGAVLLLVTSAQGRFDPTPLDMEVLMDNVSSAGAFIRERLIPPVGAVRPLCHTPFHSPAHDAVQFNTLRTGDADLRFYITTVQDG